MNVAVIGLGIEGQNSLKSLLKHQHHVYASDLNNDLDISIDNYEDMYEIHLGDHDWDKINESDAVVLSPSLWKDNLLRNIKDKDKIFSNVINDHKKLFTIGVTGTNGKTTTTLMIRDILKNAGNKVLVGGNAGGGFSGYTELMLEASHNNYDFLVVEICDMTLDFCSYNFDIDLMVVTNLGYDHMNVHKSMAHFQDSVGNFLKNKRAVLNKNDSLLTSISDKPVETHFFNVYTGDLHLIGKFNQENAAAAFKVGELIGIPSNVIKESLASFKPVDGRITEMNLDGTKVMIGKTDNVSALSALFNDLNFEMAIIGTPRKNESWRFKIFKELAAYKTQNIVLFPGLDETTGIAAKELLNNGFNGELQIINDAREVGKFVLSHYKNYKSIFIGGNGQAKILEIKNYLEEQFKG